MKNLTVLTIIFILSQILTANVCFASSENKGGFVSGSAWMDNNGNNIQELSESNIGDVIVFVENAETGKLVTAKTDASGFFKVIDLPYGRYNIWSENIKGLATPTQMIELDEVNGAARLKFAFTSAETVHSNFTIFLPIINN